MNDDPRDKAVEDAYRDVPKEAPPPELDARILAAARRAVNARPQDSARPPTWLSRYRVPLSVAATAVIAVSVSLLVDDESRRGAEFDAPAKAQRADPAWGSRSSPAGAPVEQRIPSDRDAAERARAQRNAVEAPRAQEPVNAAPPPQASEPKLHAIVPAPDRPIASPDSEVRKSEASADTAASALGDASGRAAALAKRPPAAAGAAPAPESPAATPVPSAAAERPAAQVPGVDSRDRATADRPSRLTRDELSSTAGRAAAREEAVRPPEAWLADIRRLRAEGRLTDADAALVAFQRAYPDYALPADLRPPAR